MNASTVQRCAVWVVGADQPGIVAAITGKLYELGCNIEDSSMTILSGHFAMMLVISGPDGPEQFGPEQIEAVLADPARSLNLVVAARAIHESRGAPAADTAGLDAHTYIVSVYGADHPGIVHRVTSLLAKAGINIVDLNTRVIGDASELVYAMLLEVIVPDGFDVDRFGEQLGSTAAELGVEATIHAADADVF